MSQAPALSMRLISEPSNSTSLAPSIFNVQSDLSSVAISSMTQSPPKMKRNTEFRRSVRYQARPSDWAESLRAVPLEAILQIALSSREGMSRQSQSGELAAVGGGDLSERRKLGDRRSAR